MEQKTKKSKPEFPIKLRDGQTVLVFTIARKKIKVKQKK